MADLFTPEPGDAPKIGEPIVFCGQCRHFDLEGSPLGDVGYGFCLMRPEPTRRAHYTAAENRCRTGKFQPKQPKGT